MITCFVLNLITVIIIKKKYIFGLSCLKLIYRKSNIITFTFTNTFDICILVFFHKYIII